MWDIKNSTLIGLAGGLLLLILLMLAAANGLGAFFNLPGLIVVIGGTLAATCVSRPVRDVMTVLRQVPALLRETDPRVDMEVEQLLRFSDWHRHGHLHTAERQLANIPNPFLHAGLRMIIDGCQIQDLAKALQWRMAGLRARDQAQSHILRTMATFAPAFGMLGTLFGLVRMLAGLGDSALGEIGASMAFAMLTTVYGIIAANLFFKPLAIKLERRTQQRLLQLQMLMEGMLLVHERRHTTLIRETLESFDLHHSSAAETAPVLSLVRA